MEKIQVIIFQDQQRAITIKLESSENTKLFDNIKQEIVH